MYTYTTFSIYIQLYYIYIIYIYYNINDIYTNLVLKNRGKPDDLHY